MEFSKIKKLVQQNGDKFILLEDGEPELVVMSFKEYERLIRNERETPPESSILTSEDLVPETSKKKFHVSEPADLSPMVIGESIGLPVRLEDIRLEDLPI